MSDGSEFEGILGTASNPYPGSGTPNGAVPSGLDPGVIPLTSSSGSGAASSNYSGSSFGNTGGGQPRRQPYGATAAGLGPWAARLQTASWRGLPFGVNASSIRRGRRVAVHEYPYRDDVWVEDLGRGMRQISFTGFLIGDDVYDQRDAMAGAAETAGPGELVHPSLGSVSANLTEFSAGERAELGRVVELQFSFIQTGQDQPAYPAVTADTTGAIADAAGVCTVSAASDFIGDVDSALALGADVVNAGLDVVNGFVDAVNAVVADASLIAGSVSGLVSTVLSIPGQIAGAVSGLVGSVLSIPGQVVGGLLGDVASLAGAVGGLASELGFGRYDSGGRITAQPGPATVASALSALVTARTAVAAAGAAAQAAAVAGPATSLPAALATLVSSVAAAAQDPADQIRLLSGLAGYSVTPLPGTAPIGQAIAAMQSGVAVLCRRLAIAATAQAVSIYQPSSSDDATTVLAAVTALVDTETLAAADAGDTASYQALRMLRVAVVTDLTTRGAKLPQLVTVSRPGPLPALLLAWQLYQDATRVDDLIARADPIHPAFMPAEFQALSF